MPPKSKKSAGKDSKSADTAEREEPLQAVVFADSFETRFLPFTLSTPRCLLPLAGTPLIEYTLEFLGGQGVEEVYLYCGNGTERVEAYLKDSKWMQPTSPFSLEIIRSNSRSVGDCMRDLHAKELIVGDFICVYGDVVANISLSDAMAAHKARVAKDKKCIMTMVLREAGDAHRTKSASLRPTFVIDPVRLRCVHYEQVRPGETRALELAPEALKEHVELDVREDLIDCGIDICTTEVLAQYTDNFDWQLPRRGFLNGVLKDYETFQLTAHVHVAEEGYAARVKNLRAYDAISKDVVSRWTYPLTPDTNLVGGQSFRLEKGNVYREDGVVLARSCVVGRKCVVGEGTSVGEGAVVTNSVVGRRCVIGQRVKIDGAYIWDDTHIADDSLVETAIIGEGVRVGKGCRIEKGALLSNGVVLADGTLVPGNRRISTLKRKRGYEQDTIEQAGNDSKVVGQGGTGYQMELDDEEEDPSDALLCPIHDLSLEEDSISTLDSDSEDDDAGLSLSHRRMSGRSDSFASINSEESSGARQQASDFHHEAVAALTDDLSRLTDPDTIQLEFNSLRMMMNAEDKALRRAVSVAFGKRIASIIETSASSPKDAVSVLLPKYKNLIEGCVKTEEEQAEFLLFLQTDLTQRAQGEKILLFMANALVTFDLVEAEGLERWWGDEKSQASGRMEDVRRETGQLVEVLCGDSEEEESEEGDSEDDE